VKFFLKKKQKWPKTDEEDPTVPGYKGNANQTTLRIHLTPLRMAIIKNAKQQMLVRMGM
jgi:hypothetical protein